MVSLCATFFELFVSEILRFYTAKSESLIKQKMNEEHVFAKIFFLLIFCTKFHAKTTTKKNLLEFDNIILEKTD